MNAKCNAPCNTGVTNAEFICGKVETVLDPVLRGWCGEGVLEGVA